MNDEMKIIVCPVCRERIKFLRQPPDVCPVCENIIPEDAEVMAENRAAENIAAEPAPAAAEKKVIYRPNEPEIPQKPVYRPNEPETPQKTIYRPNDPSPSPVPEPATEPLRQEKPPASPGPVGQFVYQQPVNQQTKYQQPVDQQTIYQQPVDQQTIYQHPVNQQPVYQQAITQQPIPAQYKSPKSKSKAPAVIGGIAAAVILIGGGIAAAVTLGGQSGGVETSGQTEAVNIPRTEGSSDPANVFAASTTLGSTTASVTEEDVSETMTSEGDYFVIYTWNDALKKIFEKYMPGYNASDSTLDGVTVKWVVKEYDDMVYLDNLDKALLNNNYAASEDKVDLFLAESDYITSYVDSNYTLDVSTIGVYPSDTEYKYTLDAASDSNGRLKGVSYECCPSALIYRRSIAKDVLGTDDPNEVQILLNSWEKYEKVAAMAHDKGYYMQSSYADSFRVFSNNITSPWVKNGSLNIPDAADRWTEMMKRFYDNGYILESLPGVWDYQKNEQMYSEGKTMCFFGSAWYYNFCMTYAYDSCYGDWAICKGPQAHFWGGTWMLAATGTDNQKLVAKVMNAFTIDEDVCYNYAINEGVFSNNSKVNEMIASDNSYNNEFLGGQNDFMICLELAKDIKWENHTSYDYTLESLYPERMRDYIAGKSSKNTSLDSFYSYVNNIYPLLTTP